MKTKIGHIGIVVKDAEAMVSRLCNVFGIPKPNVIHNHEKNLKVAVISIGDIGLEILEDCNADGSFKKFNNEHGNMIHHICMVTDQIEDDIAELESKGVSMINRTPKIGLRGKRISFIQGETLEGLTVELSEP